MIKLEGTDPIGMGHDRICFPFPGDPAKCVKVCIRGRIGRRQNEIEFRYINSLGKRGVDFSHIPRCYGWVDTDYGPGLVYERIQNRDSTPGHTVDEAVRRRIYPRGELEKGLGRIFDYLIANSIVFADVSLKNLLCVKGDDGLKVFAIDGLGARRQGMKFVLNMKILLLARRKTAKQIKKLNETYQRLCAKESYV